MGPILTETGFIAEDRAGAIRDRLREAIVERRLSPGAKLSESEVGALFDVSRTVARSALQMLAFEGLVWTERNRGAFVANPSPEEARQIFASRRLIEPGVVAAACERMSGAEAAQFARHLGEETRLIAERGPRARHAEIRASGDFHTLLSEVAGNAILQRFMGELIARSSLVVALYGRSGASRCGHEDHHRIVEALKRRDADLASRLMLHHIDHIEEDLDLRVRARTKLGDALGL